MFDIEKHSMKIYLFPLFLILTFKAHSRDSTSTKFSNKGLFYAHWGYNKSFFSRSDIQFISANYNVIFKNISASDRPSPFNAGVYIGDFTVPQYVFRFGYFPFARFHFSIGMDHLKYVVDQEQKTTITGDVNSAFFPKFGGHHQDDTFIVHGDDLSFEHTNGLNILSLDIDYLQPIYSFHRRNIWITWNSGIGSSLVITKTDVRIFNEGIDNRFHLSGYAFFLKTGPRIEFWKWVAIGLDWKAGYVNLPSVLIENDADKRAKHHFYYVEYYGYLSLQLPLKKWISPGKKKK